MAINPQKLAAFASKKDDKGQGKKAPPFGKGGKGGPPPHAEPQDKDKDAEEDEHEDENGKGSPDIDVEAIGERVQNGEGDKKLISMAQNIDEDSGIPAWATDADKWDEAVEMVEPYWDEYDQPFAVVAHVYKELGGQIEGGGMGKKKHEEEEHDEDEESADPDELDFE